MAKLPEYIFIKELLKTKTHQQIADRFGVTRQSVYSKIKTFEEKDKKRKERERLYGFIKKPKYK